MFKSINVEPVKKYWERPKSRTINTQSRTIATSQCRLLDGLSAGSMATPGDLVS